MTQRQSQVNVSTPLNTGLSEENLASNSGLLSINKFAQVCRTTPRTIRFYDQEGLLKPRSIDKWTGYRYYSPDQAIDFLRIRFMQNFHIPLKQIKLNLDLKVGDKYLEEKLKSLKREIEENQKEFKFLQKLKDLFFADKKLNEVFKREEVGPFSLFCLKIEHGSYDSVNEYRQDLRKQAKRLDLEVEERDIILYLDTDYRPKDTRLEFSLICKKDYSKQNINLAQNYYFRTFPKTKALVYSYQGLNIYFILVYQRLFFYIDKYKVKLKGPNFDINMEDPFIQKSPFDYRTKLVFPV